MAYSLAYQYIFGDNAGPLGGPPSASLAYKYIFGDNAGPLQAAPTASIPPITSANGDTSSQENKNVPPILSTSVDTTSREHANSKKPAPSVPVPPPIPYTSGDTTSRENAIAKQSTPPVPVPSPEQTAQRECVECIIDKPPAGPSNPVPGKSIPDPVAPPEQTTQKEYVGCIIEEPSASEPSSPTPRKPISDLSDLLSRWGSPENIVPGKDAEITASSSSSNRPEPEDRSQKEYMGYIINKPSDPKLAKSIAETSRVDHQAPQNAMPRKDADISVPSVPVTRSKDRMQKEDVSYTINKPLEPMPVRPTTRISFEDHWIIPEVGVFKEMNTRHFSQFSDDYNPELGLPEGYKDATGYLSVHHYGVLRWRDDGNRFHTVGSFNPATKTEWLELERDSRPPVVRLTGHMPERPQVQASIVIGFQRRPQTDFDLRGDANQVVLELPRNKVQISYSILSVEQKTDKKLVGDTKLPEGDILAVQILPTISPVPHSGLYWPESLYSEASTSAKILMQRTKISHSPMFIFLVPTSTRFLKYLAVISRNFTLPPVPPHFDWGQTIPIYELFRSMDSVIVDIRGGLKGHREEGCAFFAHYGIRFLKKLVQDPNHAISDNDLVLPINLFKQKARWEQARWAQALQLPQNESLRNMRFVASHALQTCTRSDIVVWDSIVSTHSSFRNSPWAFINQRVPVAAAGVRAAIILMDSSALIGAKDLPKLHHRNTTKTLKMTRIKSDERQMIDFYARMTRLDRVYHTHVDIAEDGLLETPQDPSPRGETHHSELGKSLSSTDVPKFENLSVTR